MKLRILCIAAVLAGAALGVTLPSMVGASPTGQTLSAFMSPPTLNTGQSSQLTCGWHGACGATPTAGIALDWDDSAANTNWAFRGFFAISPGASKVIATGHPLVNVQSPSLCDIMTVWIVESFNGALRAAPLYMHTNITSSSAFNITGGSVFGQYMSRTIGTTIDDTGVSCTWAGTHVHEYDTAIAGTTTTRNTGLYPTGNCSCLTYPNNIANNYTRKFVWPEGS